MSTPASVVLLENASATGSAKAWPGGRGMFVCHGTFGGTSAQLAFLGPDGTNYVNLQAIDATGVLTAVALTAAGAFIFDLPPCSLKVTLTGGGPSAMYAKAVRIPS